MAEQPLHVINLFGSPGAGKSAAAHGLTYRMKMDQFSVEMTPEFAKELAIEKRHNIFGQQMYIFGEQSKRLEVLKGQYDFAISDCPLPLIAYYTPENYVKSFRPMVDEYFSTYENLNYFILRDHAFEREGRVHSEQDAERINAELLNYLDKRNIHVTIMQSSQPVVDMILSEVHARFPTLAGVKFKHTSVPGLI